jgi:hypothetical protein
MIYYGPIAGIIDPDTTPPAGMEWATAVDDEVPEFFRTSHEARGRAIRLARQSGDSVQYWRIEP